MSTINPSLEHTDAPTADAADPTPNLAARDETVQAKELPAVASGEADDKMDAVAKLPEPAAPTDDPIGPIDDSDLSWLKPLRETKYTEVMASLTSSTATTEASQSSQGTFSADGQAGDAEPSCKQPKLNGDHAQKDTTVGNGGEELLQRDRWSAPTAYVPLTTGATNVEQLFASNTQLLFGANTNPAADPNPISTEPTSAPLAVGSGARSTSTPNFDAPLGASAANDTTANPAPGIDARSGRCHNCGQEGHWANRCTRCLSSNPPSWMIAGRASKCALCPFEGKPDNDLIIVKLRYVGCGPSTHQWVHRSCARPHFVTLGLL